jgi:Ca-activated chloride channel family protein
MVRSFGVLVLLLSALLVVPVQAHHSTSCAPEQCLPVVPLPPVPYVQGNVRFESFSADVEIQDALATTALRIELENPGATPTEVEVSLPLPDAASLVSFNLSWDGHLIEGRVRERGVAQQQYVNATQQGRDAALLQQADRHLVSLLVNVGPGDVRVLQASYVEPVPLAAGHRVYRLPLSTLEPAPEELHVDVSISSRHGVEGLRAPRLAVPVAGGSGSLDLFAPTDLEDLVLVWGEEGTRSMLVAAADPASGVTEYWAQLCAGGTPLPRDVVFVLDQSGSMAGLKIEEGRQTLVAALETLHETDRYSILTFSDGVTPFRSALVPGDPSNLATDRTKANAVAAVGSTNIDAALQEAFRQINAAESARLPMVVFMTDGLPTSGITAHDQIIERAMAANTREAPIHVVPIGLDADHTFLADLALRSGGAFVDVGAPDALMSDHLGRLMQVIAGAVVKDPVLSVSGIDLDGTVLPRTLPPLYAESCLDVRFRGDAVGPIRLKLTGQGASGPVTHESIFTFLDIPVESGVSALYGRAVVADLLATERLEPSPELRAAIIANATAYSQLTPYTAWVLADESPRVPAAGASTGTMTGTTTGSAASQTHYVGVGSSGGSQPGQDLDGRDADDSGSNQTPGPGWLVLVGVGVAVGLALRRRL